MRNATTLTITAGLQDVRHWPVHEDYEARDGLLVPVGRILRRYDATAEPATLAYDLAAVRYATGRDPSALLEFARRCGLVLGNAIQMGLDVYCDQLSDAARVVRQTQIVLDYLRSRKASDFPSNDIITHVNDGLALWLPFGLTKVPNSPELEFGYRHVGLAGVVFEQLAQGLAGALAFKPCRNAACRKLFIVAKGRIGKREDAEFCSALCRVQENRRLKTPPPAAKVSSAKRKRRG